MTDENNNAVNDADGDDKGLSLLDESQNSDADNQESKEGERPAWMPETLWDNDKKTVKQDQLLPELERSLKIAKDLRTKMAKGAQHTPKTADEYKLPEFKEEADKAVADLIKSDDPLVKHFKEVAHKNGLSQDQFSQALSEVGKFLAQHVSKTDEVIELTEEQKEAYRTEQYAKIGESAPRVVSAVSEHIRTLKAQGLLSEDQVAYLKRFAGDAEGVKILNVFRTLQGGESIPMGDSLVVDGLPSDAEIFAVMGGEKYMSGDPETHKKVDGWMTMRREAGRPERLSI